MSLQSSLIYFLLGNHFKHKEIGSYINETNNISYSQSDLNEIISISKKIFDNLDEKETIKKQNKEVYHNFNIYYTLTNTDIFYLAALKKGFESIEDEDEIYQLFDDIEYQGIKKLTDKNGELSKIGKQNLKFCIEQSNKNKLKKNNSILNFFKMNNDKEQNTNTISLLSTEINENQNDYKDGMKKLLSNIDDMGNLDKKSEKKNDFKKEEIILQKRIKCRRISFLICIIMAIVIIIISIIVFKK